MSYEATSCVSHLNKAKVEIGHAAATARIFDVDDGEIEEELQEVTNAIDDFIDENFEGLSDDEETEFQNL